MNKYEKISKNMDMANSMLGGRYHLYDVTHCNKTYSLLYPNIDDDENDETIYSTEDFRDMMIKTITLLGLDKPYKIELSWDSPPDKKDSTTKRIITLKRMAERICGNTLRTARQVTKNIPTNRLAEWIELLNLQAKGQVKYNLI